jgi:hypothetical protein
VVKNSLLERHRDRFLGAEADGVLQFRGILDQRQLKAADDYTLVGDPDADALAQLVPAEEVLERLGKDIPVDEIALLHHSRREWDDRGAAHGTAALNLGRGDAFRGDVQADGG